MPEGAKNPGEASSMDEARSMLGKLLAAQEYEQKGDGGANG